MFPFDVILFDIGGVLLTNGWDKCERSGVLDQFELDHEAFEARHTAANDRWERDEIDLRGYLDATIFYEPRGFTHAEFFAAICAQSQLLRDGALGIIKEIAASNQCTVGVLNNEAREPNQYRFDTFGLRAFIEVAFSSCFLGLRKPQPAIYRRALDILGRPAGRILFIDDRLENLAPAAAEGMQTIWFEGAEKLHCDLTSLGVF
jgi:putative hydrolase of the HAD superfamily